MGLSRSLSVGASSLRAHQQRFDVISNNLANTNTVAYKSNTANFQEQFNQIYSHGKSPDASGTSGSGGLNPLQFGLGVQLGSIQQDMTQGVIESTSRPLDMALQGSGFFVYNSNGRELYSRAGAISQDKDGNFVDSATGSYLQGYNVDTDANGTVVKDSDGVNQLSSKVSNLKISKNVVSPPRQSQNATLQGNLNSLMATGDSKKTSINIYDNSGGVRSLEFTFTKTANANEYSLSAAIDGKTVNTSSSTVTFNADGTLNTPLSLTLTAADMNSALGTNSFDATTPKDLTVKLADASSLLSGLTQFSMPNSASFLDQDGYTAGELQDLSVAQDGSIYGSFSNGQSELLGRVVVAKFTNEEGLVREGGNFYSASPNSGLAIKGTAGDVFPSTKVAGSSLEQSNVDMTTQFTDMISTQRAFEAASRTITITDQMLAEVTQLKR